MAQCRDRRRRAGRCTECGRRPRAWIVRAGKRRRIKACLVCRAANLARLAKIRVAQAARRRAARAEKIRRGLCTASEACQVRVTRYRGCPIHRRQHTQHGRDWYARQSKARRLAMSRRRNARLKAERHRQKALASGVSSQ